MRLTNGNLLKFIFYRPNVSDNNYITESSNSIFKECNKSKKSKPKDYTQQDFRIQNFKEKVKDFSYEKSFDPIRNHDLESHSQTMALNSPMNSFLRTSMSVFTPKSKTIGKSFGNNLN